MRNSDNRNNRIYRSGRDGCCPGLPGIIRGDISMKEMEEAYKYLERAMERGEVEEKTITSNGKTLTYPVIPD